MDNGPQHSQAPGIDQVMTFSFDEGEELLANRDGTDKDQGMILPQTIATLAASSVSVPGLDNNLQNGIVSPFAPMLGDLLNHGFDSGPQKTSDLDPNDFIQNL